MKGSAVRILSVDLGTSNTVAVLSAHGMPPRVVEVDGSATMPSAVFASEDGTIMVGRDAERRARLDPTRFEPNPKRRIDEQTLLLGTDVVPVTDALAAVLRRVLEETSRQLGGEQPDEVRLTHPAQWGQTRRNVLMSAARLAGMGQNILLVPEPVAAAAHFASFPGKSLAPGQALAVYDLGAGTFDVAVVGATQNGFTVLAEDGLPDLGGLDVDQALMVHVGREVSHSDPQRWQRLLRPESTGDRRTRRALQEDVKAAKEALSRHPQTEVPMPEPFKDVLVTRGELEGLVRPAMLRSVELLSRTLRSSGLTPDRLGRHLPRRRVEPAAAGRHDDRGEARRRAGQPRPAGDRRRARGPARRPGRAGHAHPERRRSRGGGAPRTARSTRRRSRGTRATPRRTSRPAARSRCRTRRRRTSPATRRRRTSRGEARAGRRSC